MPNQIGALPCRAKILSPTPENILQAAQAIQQGEVVGMPTETVYGLAGDCRNAIAVARIFKTKERPSFDPLIVHVGLQAGSLSNLEALGLIDSSQISPIVRKRADQLIQKFWPGPLTLILPKHSEIPDLVTSGLPSIAIRMPRHPVAQALIAAAQTPLAAPSANRFGRISPTTPEAVLEELGDRMNWILDGGPSQIGIESTVIRFDPQGSIWILRQGGTPQAALEEALQLSLLTPCLEDQFDRMASPGMLESHYAPKKPLYLLPKAVGELHAEDVSKISQFLTKTPHSLPIGLLLMNGDPQPMTQRLSQLLGHPIHFENTAILSPTGDLEEAARNLFMKMRLLDTQEISLILSEPCLSTHGLGYGIADRLKRASSRSP